MPHCTRCTPSFTTYNAMRHEMQHNSYRVSNLLLRMLSYVLVCTSLAVRSLNRARNWRYSFTVRTFYL